MGGVGVAYMEMEGVGDSTGDPAAVPLGQKIPWRNHLVIVDPTWGCADDIKDSNIGLNGANTGFHA